MLNGGINGPVNSPKSSSPKANGTWDSEDNYTQVKSSSKSTVVTQGLKVYLDSANPASYPGTGGTWYDISGNGLNFTGDASLLSSGQGLRSGGVWASLSTAVLNTDTHTISFVIKFNSTSTYPQASSGNWEKIFAYEPAGTDRSPGIWRFPSNRFIHWRYDTGNTGLNIGATGTTGDTTPAAEFTLDTWYHLTVVKNNATTTAYINGTPMGTYPLVATKVAGNAPIWLFPAYTAASAHMDFVQVYDRSLSNAEVVQNYNASKTRLDRIPMSYLVVAGGGGGGKDMGGGGGAGGYVAGNTYITPGTYSVSVGAGGYGSPAGNGGVRTDGVVESATGHQFTVSATNGQDSYLEGTAAGVVRAKGGGYGASSYWGYTPNQGYGGAGGSGGGASGYSDGNTGRQGLSTQTSTYGYGLGNAGGNNTSAQYWSAGGGGAGAIGASSSSTVAADGGIGVQNDILGVNYYWAGGGGGAGYSREGGNGGAGGGGAGAVGTKTGGSGLNFGTGTSGGGINSWAQVPGGNAGANTGGGGGGGSHYNATNRGGEGGSGVVIVRYADYYPDLLIAGSVRYTKSAVVGYKMYKFISGTGTFTLPKTSPETPSIVASGLQMYLDSSAQTSGETVWKDLSGAGNNATLYNSPTLSNGAYVFNGTTQYAQAPNGFNLSTGFTVCAIVNMATPSLWERIIDFGNGPGADNILFARNGTSNLLSAQLASATPGWLVHQVDVIENNTWMFVSWSYDGNTSTLGVNGTYYTLSYAVTIPNVTRTINYIGRSNWGGDAYFESGMQVVMMYNRGLSQAETTKNYLALKPRLDKVVYAVDPYAQYLKLAFPFSEEQGITDQSAAIKGSGVAIPSYSVNDITINKNVVGKFYGSSLAVSPYTRRAHVAVKNVSDLWLSNQDFTIEMWFYLTANNVGYQVFASHSGDTGDQQSGWVLILETNNGLAFYASSGGGWQLASASTNIPTTGVWHHLAVSRVSNTTRMFLDGGLVTTNTSVVNIAAPTSQTFRVGSYNWIPGGERGVSGYLQDFRLYVGVGKYTGAFTPPAQMRL